MKFMSERERLATRWPLHLDTENDWRHGRLRRGAVHTAWAQWLGRVPWQLFVTMTFDPNKVYPVDQENATREAVHWCNDASRTYRVPLGWVVAPERGTSSQWHAHVLLIGVPIVRGEVSSLPEAAAVWQARNGMIRVDPIDRVAGVTLYTTKQAAAAGAIVWSDTLQRYRDALAPDVGVSLVPADTETSTRHRPSRLRSCTAATSERRVAGSKCPRAVANGPESGEPDEDRTARAERGT